MFHRVRLSYTLQDIEFPWSPHPRHQMPVVPLICAIQTKPTFPKYPRSIGSLGAMTDLSAWKGNYMYILLPECPRNNPETTQNGPFKGLNELRFLNSCYPKKKSSESQILLICAPFSGGEQL